MVSWSSATEIWLAMSMARSFCTAISCSAVRWRWRHKVRRQWARREVSWGLIFICDGDWWGLDATDATVRQDRVSCFTEWRSSRAPAGSVHLQIVQSHRVNSSYIFLHLPTFSYIPTSYLINDLLVFIVLHPVVEEWLVAAEMSHAL